MVKIVMSSFYLNEKLIIILVKRVWNIMLRKGKLKKLRLLIKRFFNRNNYKLSRVYLNYLSLFRKNILKSEY